MGFLSWILFGLLAGLVARILIRGEQPGGCFTTVIVGIGGAFLGGLIGKVLLGHEIDMRFDLVPFLFAVVGAALLLLLLQALGGRRRRL